MITPSPNRLDLIDAYEKHLLGSRGPIDSLGTRNVHALMLERVTDMIVASQDCENICRTLQLLTKMSRDDARVIISRKAGTNK